MADFKQGDRVLKTSGVCAGKYGTVNSVREDGTLNVTFDGERLPRFCDPQRCGAVAANAAGFDNPNYDPAAGMKYLDTHFQMFDPKVAKAMIEDARRKGVKVPPGVLEKARKAGIAANARKTVEWGQDNWDGTPVNVYLEDDGTYTFWRRGETEKRGLTKDAAMKLYQASVHGPRYNSRAANAKFRVGDRVAYYGKESAIYRYRGKVSDVSQIRGETFVTVDLENGEEWGAPEKDWMLLKSARNADTPEGRRFIERAKSLMRGARDTSDLAAVRDRMVRELHGSAAISDDEKDALEGELFHAHGEEVRRRGRNAVARNMVEIGDWRKIRRGLRCKESGETGQIVEIGDLDGRQTFVMRMADGHTIGGFVDSYIAD